MRRALRLQEKGTGLRVAWPGVTFRVLAGYLAPLSRGSFCGHRVVAVVKNELVLCWAKAIGDCVSCGKQTGDGMALRSLLVGLCSSGSTFLLVALSKLAFRPPGTQLCRCRHALACS